MDGYILSYKAYDNGSRVLLNHTLFGRLISKKNKRQNISYYKRGMLDKTPFKRLGHGRIFVKSLSDISIEELRVFGDIQTQPTTLDIGVDELITGEEYWADKAHNQGKIIRPCRTRS